MGNAVEHDTLASAMREEEAAMRAEFAAESEGTGTPPTADALPADTSHEPAESVPEQTTQATDPSAASVAPAATVSVPEPVQLTKAQLDQLTGLLQAMPEIQASLEKVRRDTFGRIGGIEGLVKQIQSATPSGESVVLTREDFLSDDASRDVLDDFPLVFDTIIAGVNKALSKGKVKGTAQPAAPVSVPAEVVPQTIPSTTQTPATPATRANAEDEMEALREDWTRIIGPDPLVVPGVAPTPFRQWLATQPEPYRQKVLMTESPLILNAAITKFEQATVPAPTPQAPDASHARRARLEAAIPLKGDGRAPAGKEAQTEEQAMRDAYKTG